jgi:hypothetical protein
MQAILHVSNKALVMCWTSLRYLEEPNPRRIYINFFEHGYERPKQATSGSSFWTRLMILSSSSCLQMRLHDHRTKARQITTVEIDVSTIYDNYLHMNTLLYL